MGALSSAGIKIIRFMPVFSRSLVRILIPYILTKMPFLVPSERLYETETLVAFYHPQPVYRMHILLLPKFPIAGLAELSTAEHQIFTHDLFIAVKELVERFNLEDEGYRLVMNGGKYQEIPQLHFHLVSG